jgi:hypothetical protein
MQAIRKWKLNQAADMLRDICGEEKMASMKRQESLTDAYMMKKTSKKCPLANSAEAPYTMD